MTGRLATPSAKEVLMPSGADKEVVIPSGADKKVVIPSGARDRLFIDEKQIPRTIKRCPWNDKEVGARDLLS